MENPTTATTTTTTATPPPKVDPKPFLQRVRDFRVSRGWVIFGSVLVTYAGLRYRDSYLTDKIKAEHAERAKALANVPWSPKDRVPKVCVLLMRPHPEDSIRTAREMFNEYMKPVFDAAALDYDLVESNAPGGIQRHVAGTLAKIQRYQYWTADDMLRAKVMTSPLDDLKYFYRMQDYRTYVAMGRKPYEELVVGYSEGLAKAKCEMEEDYAAAFAAVSSNSASSGWFSGGSSGGTMDRSQLPPNPAHHHPTLPAIAYVPVNTLSGMINFPRKLYRWFNQHQRHQELGDHALAIAFSATRTLDPTSDATAGATEFGVSKVAAEKGLAVGELAEGPVVDEDMRAFWPPPANKLDRTPQLPGAGAGAGAVLEGLSTGDIVAAAENARKTAAAAELASLSSTVPTELVEDDGNASTKKIEEDVKEETPAEKEETYRKRHFELMVRYFVPKKVDRELEKLTYLGVAIVDPKTLAETMVVTDPMLEDVYHRER
ncbi:inner membrane protein import complex subunit Tim54-domain-containing protein [Blastocladiella britannica]|nr:inner membrane protein import complex subunit Tim54-domain-containing protein [Blastocladiella britannica]